jgi:hypothetical protein
LEILMPVTLRVPIGDFVIFGGTGDLAVQKLLPALYRCDRNGRLPDETRIIATARAGLDDAGYRDKIRGKLFRFVDPTARDGIAASDSSTGSVMSRELPATTRTGRSSQTGAHPGPAGPPMGELHD